MQESCQEKAAADWPAAVRFFARLGWISFGGPAGQIAILREELVERRRWLTPHEFSAGLNFCLLLPGPEAHQLVIYSGWKLHGLRGALAAGALFVLPAVLLLWLAAALYAVYGQVDWVQTVFGTVRPAVLAIIMAALVRMGRHHLHGDTGVVAGGSGVCRDVFLPRAFSLDCRGGARAGRGKAFDLTGTGEQ